MATTPPVMNSQNSTVVTADDDRSPSMAVVELVADVTGTDPLELPPLYNALDPDALDSLCGNSSGFSSLEFEYTSRTVTVERVREGLEISLGPVTIGNGGSRGIADSGPST